MKSKYGDIPFQTLITFLQSYDERKWARGALRTARVLGTATFVAVVLVSFRNFLQEKEMQEWRVGGS